MKNSALIKGTAAIAVGAALLLGGGGTLASWNASDTGAPGTVIAGDLNVAAAAGTDPDCAALWKEISNRRAANMLKFVEDLASTGELRTDRPAEELADAVWSMNGPEYWVLLVDQRGWSPERFADWLTDAWCRLLVEQK